MRTCTDTASFECPAGVQKPRIELTAFTSNVCQSPSFVFVTPFVRNLPPHEPLVFMEEPTSPTSTRGKAFPEPYSLENSARAFFGSNSIVLTICMQALGFNQPASSIG